VAVPVFSYSTLLKRVFCSTLSRLLPACLGLSIAPIARVRAAILPIAAGFLLWIGGTREISSSWGIAYARLIASEAGIFHLPRVLGD
jgi:hypothetical protein